MVAVLCVDFSGANRVGDRLLPLGAGLCIPVGILISVTINIVVDITATFHKLPFWNLNSYNIGYYVAKGTFQTKLKL